MTTDIVLYDIGLPVFLFDGSSVIVSPEDYFSVIQYRWHLKKGYALRSFWKDNYTYKQFMHTFILSQMGVVVTQGVDHRNLDVRDNRRTNVRPANQTQNMQNISKPGRIGGASSQFKGVSMFWGNGKWRARIWINGKERSLGYFDSEEDAARAYDKAARENFGEFARLNFP